MRRLLGAPGLSGSLFSEEFVAGRDLKVLRRELDRVYLTRLFRDSAGDVGKMAAVLEVKVSRLKSRASEREPGMTGRGTLAIGAKTTTKTVIPGALDSATLG